MVPKPINTNRHPALELAVSPSAKMLRQPAHNQNLLICGDNRVGQLGIGMASDPVGTAQPVDGQVKWVAVALGHGHAAGVDESRHLYTWGRVQMNVGLKVCL